MVAASRKTSQPARRGEALTADDKRELIAKLGVVLDHGDRETIAGIIETLFRLWLETN